MDNGTDQQTFQEGNIPKNAKWLGYAGLLPQVIALVLFLRGDEWRWIALAAAFAYAALIFSFLGGVWWGQAISRPNTPRWAFLAAVLPSLIGLALFIPWTLGWPWPEPSLFWLGLFLIAAPLMDRALSLGGKDWMRLRWHLSLGLGFLTLTLGILGFGVRTM